MKDHKFDTSEYINLPARPLPGHVTNALKEALEALVAAKTFMREQNWHIAVNANPLKIYNKIDDAITTLNKMPNGAGKED